ncbi:hypothetical protein ACTXT7_016113, partial [Hymenolepis weldensis]
VNPAPLPISEIQRAVLAESTAHNHACEIVNHFNELVLLLLVPSIQISSVPVYSYQCKDAPISSIQALFNDLVSSILNV